MPNKKTPTIRSSASARLLLYRLLSSYLTEAKAVIVRAMNGDWEKIIAGLEKQILMDFSNSIHQQLLGEIFGHIEKSTKRDLERQLIYLAKEKLYLGVFPRDLLDNFVKEHTQLIKNTRLEHINQIASAIQRGIRQGILPKDITKDMVHLTDISKKKARLIARNAPLQYSGAITRHHQLNAGIKKYRWQTSQDERVRQSHRAKNGKTFRWDSSMAHPRSEVNCRCDAVPVLGN